MSCKRESIQSEKKKNLSKSIEIKNLSGWWKLTNATYKPVRLINAGYSNNFTIHLSTDGTARIFKENYLDSIIQYNWKLESSTLSFGRGCIAGSNSPVYFLSDKKLIMSFDERKMDTLYFERCEPLANK
ncbi:MAG TPA: hypothetical protein VF677_02985 [Flavobacterium sp.]